MDLEKETMLYYAKRLSKYCEQTANKSKCKGCIFSKHNDGYQMFEYECILMSDIQNGKDRVMPEEWNLEDVHHE